MSTKQSIREIRTAPTGGFEDQLWPINMALLVLSGMVAGWILVTFRFDAAVWWQNAYFWLASLVVSLGVLMGLSVLVGQRIARRYQLAALFSIGAHLAILIALALKTIPLPEDSALRKDEKLPITAVEQTTAKTSASAPRANVFIMNSDSARSAAGAVDLTTQAPVETTPAATPSVADKVVKEANSTQPAASKPDLPGLAIAATGAAPLQLARAADEAAVIARRSDSPSQLSRHVPLQPQPTPSPAELPNLAPHANESGPQMAARTQELQHQIAAAVTAKQPPGELAPSAAAEPIRVASLTRRADEPKADTSSAPLPTAIKKLGNAPSQLPHTDAISESLGSVAANAQAPLQAGAINSGKQTASPFVGKPEPNVPLAATDPGHAGGLGLPGSALHIASSNKSGPQLASADTTHIERLGKPSSTAALGNALDAPLPTPGAVASSTAVNGAPGALQPAAGPAGRGIGSGPGHVGTGVPSGNGAEGIPSLTTTSTSPLAPLTRSVGPVGNGGNGDGPALGVAGISSAGPQRRTNALAGSGIGTQAEGPAGDLASSATTGPRGAGSGSLQASGGTSAVKAATTGTAGGGKGPADSTGLDSGAVQIASTSGLGLRPAGNGQAGPSGGSGPVTPTLAGGGSAHIGRGGAAIGPIADTLVEPGLPRGKGDGGTGGNGAQKGPGPLQSEAIALTRGVAGGVPGGTGGDRGGASNGLGAGGELGSALATNIARAGSAAGEPNGSSAVAGGPASLRRSGALGSGPLGANGGSAAETKADDLQAPAPLAGAGNGTGGLVGVPGGTATKQATGVPGENLAIPFGAAAGSGTVDSVVVGEPGNGIGQRKHDGATGDGPTLGNIAGSATLRRGSKNNLAAGVGEAIEEPSLAGSPGGTGAGTAGAAAAGLQAGTGTVLRRGNTAGGVLTPVDAEEGVGGLGSEIGKNVGLPLQLAKTDSPLVSANAARFPLTKKSATGPIGLDTRARDTAQGFEGRLDPRSSAGEGTGNRGGKAGRGGQHGDADTRTESAIELGLKFLAQQQAADGSWSLHKFPAASADDVGNMQTDTAATGLALLSFLGAGYDHFEEKYRPQVAGGIAFLLKHQKADGDLYIAPEGSRNVSRLYSHAIGTLALCEAYGMTGDENLRAPAQRAIDFIVKSQNKELGGWRYSPGVDSDTSVAGWQLTALRSGKYAELKVPDDTFKRVGNWLDLAQASPTDGSQYVYDPLVRSKGLTYVDESGKRWSREAGMRPNPTINSVGLLMRLYLGWNRTNQNMIRGAERLKTELPEIGHAGEEKRDTYYWYYATQVMFHMGGEYWRTWNERLHPLLANSQIKTGRLAGSWDPNGPVPDRWASVGGRIYVTTMNLLSLEVVYRHLPLYDETAK
ncbi:MAG TPA: prenyltransferase/squalene oxidase repeat-containing protein [Pirellulales bacterium]|nr:prenyltransferase/squalene oxidase repeat-containing protein [Pirellulales bacterium]